MKAKELNLNFPIATDRNCVSGGPTINGRPMFVKCAGPCEQSVFYKDVYCSECRRKSDDLAAFLKGER
jgi:hypothetical protein